MRVPGGVFALLALPALFTLGEAVDNRVRNRNNGFIISAGERREYRVYVPRTYDASKLTPLVISMHGAGGWPVQQEDVSQWDRVADAKRFIVVYPSAEVESAGPRVWRLSDVRFISDLIDQMEKTYNIDPNRVYANGLSNGGGMSFVLSCALSNRIAAVGLVASAQTFPWSLCGDRGAMPMIAFHGTADPFTKYHGGTTWMSPAPFPDIPRWTASWAHRNRCAPRPIESNIAADVSRREYVDCANDASVVLYTIRDGGHTWPGGHPMPEWFVGRTTQTINASAMMWDFFERHPRNAGFQPAGAAASVPARTGSSRTGRLEAGAPRTNRARARSGASPRPSAARCR